ncbi:MAG: hypothetical protein WCC84_08895 [Candidatus Cybelea sp.]
MRQDSTHISVLTVGELQMGIVAARTGRAELERWLTFDLIARFRRCTTARVPVVGSAEQYNEDEGVEAAVTL